MNPAIVSPVRRMLVVIPNWVGDVVLATPTLAALRAHFADAHITYLLRPYVREILEGCSWHDALAYWPAGGGWRRERDGLALARALRGQQIDLALLLTNSFRAALAAWLARIPRRVGFARDGRSLLMTDRLPARRVGGEFAPVSVLHTYAALAEHVGCLVPQRRLRLGIEPAQQQRGTALLAHYGLTARRYALVNPGAKFGATKCWLPEGFAAVCDLLLREHGLRAVLVGAPNEYPLLRAIAAKTQEPVTCCCDPGTDLGSLKVLAAQAAVLICNDTGPRHYGIAFGIPTVTIFGPTHQEWTDTGYEREIKLQARVPCGPCQLPTCPLDLRCMREVSVEMVMQAVATLLAGAQNRAAVPA